MSELVGSRELGVGVIAGIVALAVALPIARARRRIGGLPGLVGPAFAIAATAALSRAGGSVGPAATSPRVAIALAVLWVGGELASRARRALVGGAVAVAGGALLAGAGHLAPGPWVAPLVVVGPAVVGLSSADLDRRGGRFGLGPILLLVSLAGMYATVPDTEAPRTLLGVAAPLALLAWPRPIARLGAGGAYASIGLFLWVAALEGAGRPASVVGAVGALGLLVGEPLGHALRARHGPRSRPAAGLVVGAASAAQLGLALFASRVAGFAPDPPRAAALLVPVLLGAAAFGATIEISSRPPGPRRRPGPA